ncbi:MAG: hypothetical protein HOW73_48120 [Polyangiaceae bacterium]|nr:hypothetical protein [Polyangiaceae bacterium]
MNIDKRIGAAVLAGAATMFVWGGLSHMVLLKGAGFSRLPNEDRVLAELKQSIPEDGLYFFPGIDLRGSPSKEEQSSWEARFHAGPTGMIVFHPSGGTPISAKKLGIQAASHLLASAIVTWVLACLSTAVFWRRVVVAGALGAFSCLSVSTIYWSWYGYPDAFFAAQCIDMIVGWSLAGAAVAAVLRMRGAAAVFARG